MAEDKNLLEKLKDKAKATAEGLKRQYGIGITSNPWPQTEYQPVLGLNSNYKTKGFLPSHKIAPVREEGEDGESGKSKVSKYGNYRYKDWKGQLLTPETNLDGRDIDKFSKSREIPKSDEKLSENPYSTRDFYSIFNDNATDYFKHGLQILDGKNGILGSDRGTPFENNDPVIFGFEIIFDDISSPLLNGAIDDFLNNYSGISEISSKRPVYEDFKKQFSKFFKTRGSINENDTQNFSLSKSRLTSEAESTNGQGINILQPGKSAYMAYYLKKISGLNSLIEKNTPKDKSFLVNYNTDVIKLNFLEDTSLSIGTLNHLYKLLYWSRPNGKSLIPENLLRFNCEIIISEIRNFKRVKKILNSTTDFDKPKLQIVKDNVSRHIYSLRECQFYFNNTPHSDEVDMSATPTTYDDYQIQFDYKYSTNKLERFMPTSNGDGQYIGYNRGAIWKTGNKGSGTSNRSNSTLTSIPKFYTANETFLSKAGEDGKFILSIPEENRSRERFNNDNLNDLENLKQRSNSFAKDLKNTFEDVAIRSASRELQTFVNTRTAILNRTLNKILDASGVTGMRPPRNVYTDRPLNAGERIFYDVRGEVIEFLGNSAAGALGGGGFTGGGLSSR